MWQTQVTYGSHDQCYQEYEILVDVLHSIPDKRALWFKQCRLCERLSYLDLLINQGKWLHGLFVFHREAWNVCSERFMAVCLAYANETFEAKGGGRRVRQRIHFWYNCPKLYNFFKDSVERACRAIPLMKPHSP